MTEETATLEPEAETPVAPPPEAARVPMKLVGGSWSFRMAFTRNGRGAGERTEINGALEISGGGAGRPIPIRAVILPKDAKLRMELNLVEPEATLVIPLEEYALARLREGMKEYSGDYGMALTVAFDAAPTSGRQLVDEVLFSFEKPAADV